MRPGEHSLAVGSPARQWGHLRDTILILMPGPRVMVVSLHRWPLDGTVAETVLKHGCGGINIDACRVVGISPSVAQEHPGECLGRWPPNVLLVHGPGCQRTGSTEVPAPVINRFLDGMKPFGNGAGHPYEQTSGGVEQIDVWDCEPGCPVRVLDEQSDYSTTKPHAGDGKPLDTRDAGWGFRRMASDLADEGTATRFFPQFACLDEALAWLQRLTGVVPVHDENREVP